MSNWRELGEVPDSEDEGDFAGQDFRTGHLPAAADTTSTGLGTDIWDIPGSQPDPQTKPTGEQHVSPARVPALDLPASSPLSSALSVNDLPPVGIFIPNHDDIGTRGSSGFCGRTPPAPDSFSQAVRWHQDKQAAAPEEEYNPDALMQFTESGRGVEHYEARHAAVQYSRSLRPRKPIQEHPYQLENALYSNILRKHGVRPLRVTAGAVLSGRDHTSRGDDFEDTSQDTAEHCESDANPTGSIDSFPRNPRNPDISPSPSPSPPKTSSLVMGAGKSSQASSQDETDSTSVADQDLPALEDLLRRPSLRSCSKTALKRQAASTPSGKRKRRRLNVVQSNLVDSVQTSSPEKNPTGSTKVETCQPQRRTTIQVVLPQPSISSRRVRTHSVSPRATLQGPQPAPDMVIDVSSDDGSETDKVLTHTEAGDSCPSQSETESDTDLVNTLGQRIRGVLPASWLRLDHQSSRAKAQDTTIQRQYVRSGREDRRGIARAKQTRPSTAAAPLQFDESSDDADEKPAKSASVQATCQTDLTLYGALGLNATGQYVGQEESVGEDNYIDLPIGRNRELARSSRSGQKPSAASNDFMKARRQPRQLIHRRLTCHVQKTQSLSRSGLSRITKQTSERVMSTTAQRFKSYRNGRLAARSPPPQPLSILDVLEPDAPRFLKIAARTARKRLDKGRCSPRHKAIQLATRQDHVDAISILHDWREGKISQRTSVSPSESFTPRQPPLKQLNEGSQTGSVPKLDKKPIMMTTHRLVKHVSSSGSPSFRIQGRLDRQTLASSITSPHRFGWARPAQLELEESDQIANAAFYARKRLLDRLYRIQHLKLTSKSPAAKVNRDPSIASNSDVLEKAPPSQKSLRKQRPRKTMKPTRVDLDAPHYRHANDPLPRRYSPEPEPARADRRGDKMLGLGPYGTNYTIHFEVFPPHPGVYFHESTLIGMGMIESCSSANILEKTKNRPRSVFTLNDQGFNWGPFDPLVSSELGIVLDVIADQIEAGRVEESCSRNLPVSVAAAEFILNYLKDSVSFEDARQARSIASRTCECLHSFNERLKTRIQSVMRGARIKQELIIRVYDRLLLAALLVLKYCRSQPMLMTETFRIEKCLRSMAQISLSVLSNLGTTRVRETFKALNDIHCRQHGIREDHPIIHSWVLLMKILHVAEISRASFWELSITVLIPRQVVSSVDARDYERCWQAMFILLPLTAFNSLGVIVSGRRCKSADGWAIPQMLLKQVFHLYQQNSRQSPSFNSYCRALLGRCFCLVQQWGWHRSAIVVGLIFDFFGSENLAHLRNEEVSESPLFLEELARRPSLEVEPSDKCFHVFLKLVAISIKKLKEDGATKDIRNMVARIIPNHNRQYLKEQIVHARDLAALRNHHDLLGTLFWASPPEFRPPASLIERLVDPASSHKEACLINIRNWNQLARFVVASGEAPQSFKPFAVWRNNLFQQVLRQFDTVASDVCHEVHSLARDIGRPVSDDVVRATIMKNKSAIIDVLYASAAASLDVMRHTPDLETATFALNTLQLQAVFRQFSLAPPELDWGILSACLAALDLFLIRIDEFKETEASQQSESQIFNSTQAEDALLLVDRELAQGFFSMARCVLSSHKNSASSVSARLDKRSCSEQIVTLSARMGIRFIDAGTLRFSDMFKVGKYGLFNGAPHKLGLDQRRNLILFILTLLRSGKEIFLDTDLSLFELWTLLLVTPREYSGYEIQLAHELLRQGKDFVPGTVEGRAAQSDYSINLGLFEYAVSTMRRSIRDAELSTQRVLLAKHSRTLKLVMEQIKSDLATVSSEPSGHSHSSYVIFVQGVISLIKTHGADICAVDTFFLQISKEYSPSIQDPNLQVAGLVSYGLRLREGDSRSGQQLFFLLFNNIKFAMINGRLEQEVLLLTRGMRNPGIMEFIVGKMLPAIVRSCSRNSAAFPLMDVYATTLRLVLTGKAVPHELDVNDLTHLNILVHAVVEGVAGIMQTSTLLSGPQLHLTRQMITILNLLWPSLYTMHTSANSCSLWAEVLRSLRPVLEFVSAADVYLGQLLHAEQEKTVRPPRLCLGMKDPLPHEFPCGSEVEHFTKQIILDIQKNWLVTAQAITVQTPGNCRQGISSPQGIRVPAWDMEDMIRDLRGRAQEWRWWWHRLNRVGTTVNEQSIIF
ncbi:hypothetical protein CDD83_1833 [Cordyceps sp. RAO-2017]|nr:hypothetical protein CDD83_1833 [Cordyceps sp. RAO-2017]